MEVKMNLKGVHFLLSYQCTTECDHCFVWGSPWAKGTFSLKDIQHVLEESRKLKTVEWIYLEGGEPFMFYPIMLKASGMAKNMGFKLGLVTNCYWATTKEDALEWLRPMVQIGLDDVSVSGDLYHGDSYREEEVICAISALKQLNVPVSIIAIKREDVPKPPPKEVGGLPYACDQVLYKGRAAEKLASKAKLVNWTNFKECKEDIADPKRVHIDALGYVHVCQGISIGNFHQKPFGKIIEDYKPEDHPILGPLLKGGPMALVERYNIAHEENYADACHLCYECRVLLRERFPDFLCPDQMYGVGLD
jgi:MoaA/NifB/PqqE/SkfB family radical SAM enzyme